MIRVGTDFEKYVESIRQQLEKETGRKVTTAEASDFIAKINRGASMKIDIEMIPYRTKKKANFFGY